LGAVAKGVQGAPDGLGFGLLDEIAEVAGGLAAVAGGFAAGR